MLANFLIYINIPTALLFFTLDQILDSLAGLQNSFLIPLSSVMTAYPQKCFIVLKFLINKYF